ncbi:MAG: CDP-alcohol phosphatidyltransferase family protein [Desulfomonilaceae bacterium]|nr:CDP-alcohol phosphatidyltransferase family protein [Desulfomonilaceae bacterium]
MAAQSPQFPGDGTGGFKSKSPKVFLNYFGKDRWIHARLAEKRTRLVSVVVPPLNKLGLVPDTISYVGIAFLIGVVLYFVRSPVIAVLFLAGHVICDGVDGAYARHTGKPSQSGAFTDLVCDQLGMVVVAMMAILHHMVSPLLGAVYVALYLIVVVFGVIINVLGIGTRITITSKYFLYLVFAIWAFWGTNLFPPLMYFFSAIMAVEVVIGYLRLKRGIRRKFDTEVRFTEGDPYSGRLNYALNTAVPITVLAIIFIGANVIPLRALFDKPDFVAKWDKGPNILGNNADIKPLCFGIHKGAFLVLVRLPDDTLELRRIAPDGTSPHESFVVPSYVCPAFSTLPVDGNVVLIADSSTRLILGIDLDASFARNYAVTVMNLPVRYLSVTAGTVTTWNGKRVWLAANYLYTRKTYVVDPEQALRQGYILGGKVASYTNGAFPSGMTVYGDTVFEFNKSPLEALIYQASLKNLVKGKNLLDAGEASFRPPDRDALGPVSEGDELFMLSRAGQVHTLPIRSLPGMEASSK